MHPRLPASGAGAGTNYIVAGSHANKFFRLFGDEDGNRKVDFDDFQMFRLAYNAGPSTGFDLHGDGQVDFGDFQAFRVHYNMSV